MRLLIVVVVVVIIVIIIIATALDGLCLSYGFFNSLFFMVWGFQPQAQHPTWRTRVSLFAWIITFDPYGLGGSTSSYVKASIALRII